MYNSYTNDNIFHPSDDTYSYSTEAGVQDATVVGTQIGNDFGFKPLASGDGMDIDETTNIGSITFTNTADLQLMYDNGNDIVMDNGELRTLSSDSQGTGTHLIGNSGTVNDGDLILKFPNLGSTPAVLYWIEAVFTGVNTTNGLSFAIKFQIKFDPTTPASSQRLLFNKTRITDLSEDINPTFNSGNIDFIFNSSDPYRITWKIETLRMDK